jgi:hypothetical protein
MSIMDFNEKLKRLGSFDMTHYGYHPSIWFPYIRPPRAWHQFRDLGAYEGGVTDARSERCAKTRSAAGNNL